MSYCVFVEHKRDSTGKMKFIDRLIPELKKLGVKCHGDKNKKSDMRLALTHFRGKYKDGPTAIRIDGSHFTQDPHSKWNNKRTVDCMKKSKAVIYQSPWCKQMSYGIMKYKRPKRDFVIFNGANPEDYKEKIDLGPGKHVLLCANWKQKTHKRLTEMTEIASQYPKAHFWVAGNTELKVTKAENITYLGLLAEPELQKYNSSCHVMLNLPHWDWCPNAVVECLVAGMPVVYTSGTGMTDLVGESGVAVKDSSPKPRLMKVKIDARKHVRIKVPKIDYEEVKHALDIALEMPRVHRPDLFIENIAKQYYKVFKAVLGGKT